MFIFLLSKEEKNIFCHRIPAYFFNSVTCEKDIFGKHGCGLSVELDGNFILSLQDFMRCKAVKTFNLVFSSCVFCLLCFLH